MIRILLDHTKLTQREFKDRLELIFKKMNGNTTYSLFQELITVLRPMALAYSEALFIAEDGGSVVLKNKLRLEGNAFLTKLAKKLEVYANDLPTEEEGIAFVKGSGYNLQESNDKKNLTFLEVPADLYVVDERLRKGACTLSWKSVLGALTYLIEELDKDGVWHNCGVSKKTTITITGTESEVKKTFRIRAIGPGTLMSGYTDAVSVWVH